MSLLTKEEYQATLITPMLYVTNNAEEIIDLWGYINPIIETEYHNCTTWNWRVDHIYESANSQYQHIGIPVPKDDTYLIVVIDKPNRLIIGHYLLDLHFL